MNRVLIFMSLVLATCGAFAYNVEISRSDLSFTTSYLEGFKGDTVVNLRNGYLLPANPGEPSLPSLSISVALPTGMAIDSVNILHAEPEILPGYYHLFPSQPPSPIGVEATKFTSADPKVYSSSNPFPGNLVHAVGSGNMGGYSIGNIVLVPVQYVPATGQLILYRNIEFSLNLKPAEMEYVYPQVRYDWADRELRQSISAMVINPTELASPPTQIVNDVGPTPTDMYAYLIIAASGLDSTAQSLANWETRKGRRAAVLALSYVIAHYSGVDTQEQIRNCIKDYYQTKGTQFVCLIGTGGNLPMRKCYDPSFDTLEGDHLVPTDNYYGCLDGNWNADGDGYWGEYPSDDVDFLYDVWVGRIQVDNADWLTTVTNKTLCYESGSSANDTNPYDYQQKAIMAGGWLDSSTNEMVLMQTIESSYLNSPFYAFTNLWDTTYPGGAVFNGTNFINQMNAGHGIIAHASHSNTTILGTNSGNISSSQLYALTNHPRFTGLFNTLGCYDANTDNATNCAAYFVNAPTGGGVNFVGNTRYGWYSPGSPADGYSSDFQKSYFQYFGQNNEYISGRTTGMHKIPFQGYMSDSTYRYIDYEIYLTGDPDVWVPSNTIGTLNVTYQSQIGGGQQNYTVHVADSNGGAVSFALVCVWKSDQVYGSEVTGMNGDVTFSINPSSSGPMLLTVSCENFKTFLANVTVNFTGVDLISFSSQRTNRGAQLQWQVSNPQAINSFNLYRRLATDTPEQGGKLVTPSQTTAVGVNRAVRLKEQGWVKINQNPIVGRNPYSFIDGNVGNKQYEYMLEAVMDAKSQGLGTTVLPAGSPVSFGMTVLPNPTNSVAYITVNLASADKAKVSLYDLSGRMVRQIVNAPLPAGSNSFTVDVSSLSKGIYIVELTSGSSTAVKRFVVSH